MTYTHYWLFTRDIRDLPEGTYQRALVDVQRLLAYVKRTEPGLIESNTDAALTSLHCRIQFNGSTKSGRDEPFVLSAKPLANPGQGYCRTNRLPYDKVVTAALILLQARLGKAVMVGSDGTPEAWKAGLSLARAATGQMKGLKIPAEIQAKPFGSTTNQGA